MINPVFLTLPVADLPKSVAFFEALAAGGTTYDEPEDLGFMYSHSFVDLDGHGWGVLHMSPQDAT